MAMLHIAQFSADYINYLQNFQGSFHFFLTRFMLSYITFGLSTHETSGELMDSFA